MEQLSFDRLQDNLKRLKLFKAVEIFDDVATISQQSGGSYLFRPTSGRGGGCQEQAPR